MPAKLIGRNVRVSLRASEVVILDGKREVARHPRQIRKGAQSLVLDHYLEVLVRKPGALPGATALAQARASGDFTAEHEAFWAAARAAHGDAGGTRALVEVLLLHRHMAPGDVVAALAAVVPIGATSADVVAVEARKVAAVCGTQPATTPSEPAVERPRVISPTERRLGDPAAVIAGLPADERPMPRVDVYDELLARRAPATPSAGQPATASHEGHIS